MRAGLQVHMTDADDQGREVRLVVAVQIRLQGRVLVDLAHGKRAAGSRTRQSAWPRPSSRFVAQLFSVPVK